MTVLLLVEQFGDEPSSAAALAAQLERLPVRGGLEIVRLPALRSTSAGLAAVAAALDSCADRGVGAVVATPSLVVTDSVLLRIVDDPSLACGALVESGALAHAVATQGAAVLGVATSQHPVPDADAEFLGVFALSPAVLAPAAAAVRSAADVADRSWSDVDLLDLMLAAIVRSDGAPVSAVRVEPLPGYRVATADDAQLAMAAVAIDDPWLAERHAARTGDGFYSTFVLRRVSARLTPLAVRAGIAANAVTVTSALVGLLGAGAFALASYPWLVVGAVLLQVSLVLDCVDGEIARSTRTRSPFGGWLDGATDRVKEYAALAGLAVAAAHDTHDLWTIAALAMVVQTARHMQDFAFSKGVMAAWRAGFRDHRPLTDTSPWQRPAGAGADALEPSSASMWLRRIIHFPIGERWLVLSIAALCGSPPAALIAYLALTSFAEAWSLLGALRRTTAAVGAIGASLRATLAEYRDDGLLALVTAGRSPGGWLAWALAPLVTAVEGVAVVAVTAACRPSWVPAAFGWFAVVAWHRYDVVYRRGGAVATVPAVLCRAGGGWLVRTLVVLAAAAVGALPVVLLVGTGWLMLVFVPESLQNGFRARIERISAPDT